MPTKPLPQVILMVDDEPALRFPLKAFLEAGGYRVLEANDSDEALQVSRKHKGPIHLLLTDVVMPGMDGYDLALALAAERPDTKVLFMSGYPDRSAEHRDPWPGGAGFIQKPFIYALLIQRIQELIGRPELKKGK